MKILNLVNSDKSDIQFKISKFPDGQQQVKVYVSEDDIDEGESVQIRARLNNFMDLEIIICAVKSLQNCGIKTIHLYVPYFLGSRSDRLFEDGSNNYLKQVICPAINNLNLDSVMVLDPHSDVLEACLNNYIKVDNEKLVGWALYDLHLSKIERSDICFISPDAGASKKIYKLAEHLQFKGEIFTCSKDREVTGALTKCVVPVLPDNKSFIIIDDICDGGRTFINIAKEIKKQYGLAKIYLIVTHGIFSAGYEELSNYFEGIYCTNSYLDVFDKLVEVQSRQKSKDFVKQFNVFN